jgi:hypothetical protein
VKSFVILLAVAAFGVLLAQPAFAQTAQQTLTLTVGSVADIDVSGSAISLTVDTYTMGSETMTPATDASTTYRVLHNSSSAKKITAGIDAAVPSGTTLEVNLQSSKGTGAGDVDISNAVTAVDVVTGIARGADNNQLITYTFSATTAANPFSDTRVVTFTLTD